MNAPIADIEGVKESHRVLLAHVATITEEEAHAPSLLPDWTVGHVLTHLARNADSVVRRLDGAARGQVIDQYPGGYAARAAEIAAGSRRPAPELIEDVRESAARLEAACSTLPDEVWDRPTRNVNGSERAARTLILARWREVEVHHVDLGLGYEPVQWPKRLVAACLSRELERLPVRSDPNDLLAWLIGRGPAPSLANW